MDDRCYDTEKQASNSNRANTDKTRQSTRLDALLHMISDAGRVAEQVHDLTRDKLDLLYGSQPTPEAVIEDSLSKLNMSLPLVDDMITQMSRLMDTINDIRYQITRLDQ